MGRDKGKLFSDLRLAETAPTTGWYDANQNIVNIKPGERIPQWIVDKYNIPQRLIHPDSIRNKDAFDFASRVKGKFSVGIIRDMNGRGDVLMASVIAKALKHKYGDDVSVWYAVQPGYERILEKNPWIDVVLTDRRALTRMNPDIVYNVNDLEFRAETREYEKTKRVTKNRASIYLENMDLFLENKTPFYWVKPAEREWAWKELRRKGHKLTRPIIGLQLYGSNASRTYPNMKKVGKALRGLGYQTFILDKKVGGKWQYDITKIGALAEQMFLIITPNSYFYHLAGAMGKRAVALFGSCNGNVWTQDYEKITVAQFDDCPIGKVHGKCWWKMVCLPGKDIREKEVTHAPPCLETIAIKKVLAKVEEHAKARKILVAVTTFNLLYLTKLMIDSVRSFHNYDIYVIDNKSNDGTLEWLEEQKKSGRIKDYVSEAWTVPEAWNHGLKYGYEKGYDYILLCNNDIILSDKYIDKVVEALERRNSLAATGRVINKHEATESTFTDLVKQIEQPIITMNPGDYSALLISRECIEKVGQFRIFAPRYQSDEDHLLRIRLLERELVRVYSTTFFHKHGAVVKEIPEIRERRKAEWKLGIRNFKKFWGIEPYEERQQLGNLVIVKRKNLDWKDKILVKFKGVKSGKD